MTVSPEYSGWRTEREARSQKRVLGQPRRLPGKAASESRQHSRMAGPAMRVSRSGRHAAIFAASAGEAWSAVMERETFMRPA